jgi:preprotein translocase subunit SecA
MRLFGGEKMKGIMARIGMEPGDPIYHPLLNRSIERAQKKVEERNFEIRKHLLEYDDVLNQQRRFIYEQRDAILSDTGLKQRVNEASADMVKAAVETFSGEQRRDGEAALRALTGTLKTKFNYTLPPELLSGGNPAKLIPEALEKTIVAGLEKDTSDKEALITAPVLNNFIRAQYLQFIDRLWLDHLENMEGLREAVYLRHYAQKNPLTEYKLEGFQIFDTMIDKIREEIASRVHLVRIQLAPDRSAEERPVTVSASHGSMGAFAATHSTASTGAASRSVGNTASASAQRAASEKVTVVRTQPKVGRNDPCPCGSGKKYKHCHGR